MKTWGMVRGYRYAHDEPDAVARGEQYFPMACAAGLYQPVARGLQIKIGERVAHLRSRGDGRATAPDADE